MNTANVMQNSYGNDYPTTKLGGFDYPAPSCEDSENSYPEPTEEAYPGASDSEDYYPTPSEEHYPEITDAPYYGGEDSGPDVYTTSTTTLTYTLTSTRYGNFSPVK